MLRRIFILITCSFLFSSCLSTTPKPISSSPTSIPSELTPYSTKEGNAAVTPGIPDPGSLPTVMPATAYPVPTSSSTEEAAYPALISTLMPVPTTSPFSDCGRTPGIPGCNSSVPRLAGHIAFYDVAENRLIGLDLHTGQGWSVSISQPKNLEWSPDGSQLLVRLLVF